MTFNASMRLGKPKLITSPLSAVVADMTKLRSLPATVMTGLRFVGTPIWCVLILLGIVTNLYWIFGVMIFLCVTDGLDGLAARMFNGRTYGGARFDEITDKAWSVMTFGLLVGLFAYQQNIVATLICSIALVIFAARDYHVTRLRNVVNIPSSYLGKLKTTLQMVSALLLLFAAMSPENTNAFLLSVSGIILLCCALSICLMTWVNYYQAYRAQGKTNL